MGGKQALRGSGSLQVVDWGGRVGGQPESVGGIGGTGRIHRRWNCWDMGKFGRIRGLMGSIGVLERKEVIFLAPKPPTNNPHQHTYAPINPARPHPTPPHHDLLLWLLSSTTADKIGTRSSLQDEGFGRLEVMVGTWGSVYLGVEKEG